MGGCSSTKPPSANTRPGVVDIFIFPRTSCQVHVSVPCHKVEAYLRLRRIPYIVHTTLDFDRSPNGRLPFALIPQGDGQPPKFLAESEHIIDELERVYPERVPLLTAAAAAQGRLLQTAWEYSRLHVLRWQLVDHLDWTAEVSRDYAPSVPMWILKAAMGRQFRAPAIDALNVVGEGDMPQYQNELLLDLTAMAQLISANGSKGFVVTTAEQGPTRYDVLLFAHFSTMLLAKKEAADCPAVQLLMKEGSTLCDYQQRMQALVWGPDKLHELMQHGEKQRDAGVQEWTEEYLVFDSEKKEAEK